MQKRRLRAATPSAVPYLSHRVFAAGMMRVVLVSCLCVCFGLAGPGFAQQQTPGGQVLELSGAWIRAMPPTQRMTAAYLSVHNAADHTVTIEGVSASVGNASLHETRVEGGRSMMKPVESLPIPAGGSVALEPGGLHIMLMGLERVPVEGEGSRICLQTGAGEVCTTAEVRRSAPESEAK